jgi:hypothetical protein
MTELTTEEARRLSRIVPSVPIEKYTHAIDNAILEAAGKGHFEISARECLGPWTLTDAEVREIKSHYENKGFVFGSVVKDGPFESSCFLEEVLMWSEKEVREPSESNDATSDREALVEYLGSIKIND